MTPKEAIDWCEQFIDNLVLANIDTKKRTLGLQAMQTIKSALDLINRYETEIEQKREKVVDLLSRNEELKTINECLKIEIKRLKSDVSVSKDAYMSMKDRYEYEKKRLKKQSKNVLILAKR